jgi:hypothetical protein
MYANRFLTQSRKGAEKRRGLSFLLCATLRLCVSALIFSPTAFGQSITATKAYVDRKYSEATNAVASIVTNEVAGGWICEMKERGHLYEYRDPPYFFPEDEVWALWLWTDGGADKEDFYCRAPEDATELNFTPWLTLRRTSCNALGLAMAKDLEKLPDHETVTNIARDVSNSFWDERNEVLWRLEFRDGEPMFVPVTNENVKATGGVL